MSYSADTASQILSGLTSNVLSCVQKLSTGDTCCTIAPILDIKPWAYNIIAGDNCSPIVKKRTENGWTLDFVFNREGISWSGGSTFYYWGIMGESVDKNYLDNNLSFSFTDDGRIKWSAYRYSGYCETNSGYTEVSYISTGQTDVLCQSGTSEDFNITITFERNLALTDCDIENRGGVNDLITGWTVTNVPAVITGDTEIKVIVETLNKKWNKERNFRLGTLKIYHNGYPIYRIKDFEEVIPSQRDSTNPLIQMWGGGSVLSGGGHSGTTEFNVKRVLYFEEPLDYPEIRQYYYASTKPYFSINECKEICIDDVQFFTNEGLLTEDYFILMTEDDGIITY